MGVTMRKIAVIGSLSLAAILLAGVADAANGIWFIRPVKSAPGSVSSVMSGVSCWSNLGCVGVGLSVQPTSLAQRAQLWAFNGRQWLAPIPLINPSPQAWLNGVSCVSGAGADGLCMSVGSKGNKSGSRSTTMAALWNGRHYRYIPTPNVAGASNNSLNAVSCPAINVCVGVGFDRAPTGSAHPLTMIWHGSNFALQTPPILGPATSGTLTGVSCLQSLPIECLAVGSFSRPGETGPWAAWLNRGHWIAQVVPIPPHTTSGLLHSVSCNVTMCVATGQFLSGPSPRALVENWKVMRPRWSLLGIPPVSPGTSLSGLNGVSCPTPTICASVGSAIRYGRGWPYAIWMSLRSSGSWEFADELIANPVGRAGALVAVSCPSYASCRAVGTSSSGVSTSGITPLAEDRRG